MGDERVFIFKGGGMMGERGNDSRKSERSYWSLCKVGDRIKGGEMG